MQPTAAGPCVFFRDSHGAKETVTAAMLEEEGVQ